MNEPNDRSELREVTKDMSHRARSYVVQSAVMRYGAVGAVQAILEAVADPDAVRAALRASGSTPDDTEAPSEALDLATVTAVCTRLFEGWRPFGFFGAPPTDWTRGGREEPTTEAEAALLDLIAHHEDADAAAVPGLQEPGREEGR